MTVPREVVVATAVLVDWLLSVAPAVEPPVERVGEPEPRVDAVDAEDTCPAPVCEHDWVEVGRDVGPGYVETYERCDLCGDERTIETPRAEPAPVYHARSAGFEIDESRADLWPSWKAKLGAHNLAHDVGAEVRERLQAERRLKDALAEALLNTRIVTMAADNPDARGALMPREMWEAVVAAAGALLGEPR